MKKSILFFLLTALLVSFCFAGRADEMVTFEPQLSEEDHGEVMWWVGTNLKVELTGGTGFTMTALDGTMNASDVAWGFTYAQLKQTPWLNIGVANNERVSESPYMKLYFMVNSKNIFTVAPFEDNLIEHWVKASAMKGQHSINLKEMLDLKVPLGVKDDSLIILFLYTDPASGLGEPFGPLKISELYLSSDKVEPDPTEPQPTDPPTDPTKAETPTEPSGQDPTQDTPATNAGTADGSSAPVGLIVGIIAGVAVAAAVIICAVFFVKKKKQ